MKLIIHRGTHTIGGNCIEIDSDGHRIILDLGLPLMGRDGLEIIPCKAGNTSETDGLLPNVSGLYRNHGPAVDAVLLSHAHMDHHGLLGHVHPDIPVYMSRGSHALIDIGNVFYPEKTTITSIRHFQHWEPFTIGPFTITPYLVDHSAFDASAFLIESQGKKVFYTGDLRAHGRKGKVFENLLRHPPPDLDCLITEGTTLNGKREDCRDEPEVEKLFSATFKQQKDVSFVITSGSNIDRLVSIYKASLHNRKTLVIDLYTAYVLDRLKEIYPSLPPHEKDNIRIYYMHGHARKLSDNGLTEMLYRFRPRRIKLDEIARDRASTVIKLPVRRGMERVAAHLLKERPLREAQVIYSMWPGYLDRSPDINDFCSKYDISLKCIHTSGHIYLADLQRLVVALHPSVLIPVHTLAGDSFASHFPNVVRLDDGIAWEF